MTLYSQSTTGKILVWEIEVLKNQYRTITGQEDGQKVISEWTTCNGKNIGRANETTPEEQAIQEAEAHIKKKLKSGYHKDRDNASSGTSYMKPMLANKFPDHKHKIQYPVMVDRKYNGVRCITTIKGMFTRKGEEIITAPHIRECLEPIFEKFPDMVIDGELYNQEYADQLNELVKLVRKTKHYTEQDLIRSKEIVKYYVYDGYNFLSGIVPVAEQTNNFNRRWYLQDLFKNYSEMIVPVDNQTAQSEEHLMEIYESYLKEGMEGAIIRNPNAPYHHKRSNDLLKLKPLNDNEFEILDIKEGIGNWSGAAKIVTLKMDSGKIFDGSIKGCFEDNVQILINKNDWIGSKVTVRYNGLTGLGTPNFAQWSPNNSLRAD
jgi:ATP-dependent DNA ligase